MFLNSEVNRFLDLKNTTTFDTSLNKVKLQEFFLNAAIRYLNSFGDHNLLNKFKNIHEKLGFLISFMFFYSVGMSLHPVYIAFSNPEDLIKWKKNSIGLAPFYLKLSPHLLNEILINYSSFKSVVNIPDKKLSDIFDEMSLDVFQYHLKKTPFNFFPNQDGSFNLEMLLNFYVNSDKTNIYLLEKAEKFSMFVYLFFLQNIFYSYSKESSFDILQNKKSKMFVLAIENIRRYYLAFLNNLKTKFNFLLDEGELNEVLNFMLSSSPGAVNQPANFFDIFGGFEKIEKIFTIILFDYWLNFFNLQTNGEPNQLILIKQLSLTACHYSFLWNFELDPNPFFKESCIRDSKHFAFDIFGKKLNYLKVPLICNSLDNLQINSDIFYTIRDPNLQNIFNISTPYNMWSSSYLK